MKLNKYFVIDFDSTFTKVEAFDVLADISLNGHPDKDERKKHEPRHGWFHLFS